MISSEIFPKVSSCPLNAQYCLVLHFSYLKMLSYSFFSHFSFPNKTWTHLVPVTSGPVNCCPPMQLCVGVCPGLSLLYKALNWWGDKSRSRKSTWLLSAFWGPQLGGLFRSQLFPSLGRTSSIGVHPNGLLYARWSGQEFGDWLRMGQSEPWDFKNWSGRNRFGTL